MVLWVIWYLAREKSLEEDQVEGDGDENEEVMNTIEAGDDTLSKK